MLSNQLLSTVVNFPYLFSLLITRPIKVKQHQILLLFLRRACFLFIIHENVRLHVFLPLPLLICMYVFVLIVYFSCLLSSLAVTAASTAASSLLLSLSIAAFFFTLYCPSIWFHLKLIWLSSILRRFGRIFDLVSIHICDYFFHSASPPPPLLLLLLLFLCSAFRRSRLLNGFSFFEWMTQLSAYIHLHELNMLNDRCRWVQYAHTHKHTHSEVILIIFCRICYSC